MGSPFTCRAAASPSATQTQCVATFGQWAACMPGFLDVIATDPCKVLISLSQTELDELRERHPGLRGHRAVRYTITV